MRPPARLTFDALEDRTTPAAFGIPWTNGTDITISFPADGAAVQWAKNEIYAEMAADGFAAPAAWQSEILRAFETWAKEANMNVGVVADNNSSHGTIGLPEGDPRFGDIRVFARPLADNVLAVTTPPGPSSATEAGDIIINSNMAFGTGVGKYDLYTAVLQEAGHALGVGNSADPLSAMYETYRDTRAGISTGDAAAVRALYGPRAGDAFEGTGNGTIATAKPLSAAAGTSTRFAAGDLSAAGDSDVYSFTTPAAVPNGVTVSLTAGGLALTAARVFVYDAAGATVAAATAAGPGGNFSVVVPNAAANTTYFVKVKAAASTVFAVGGYQLRVVTDPAAADPLPPPAAPTYVSDSAANETPAAATQLSPVSGTTSQLHYEAFGKLDSTADKDVYKIQSPVLPPGVTTTLLVRILPKDGTVAAYPRILTADGRPAAYEVVATEGAQRVCQLKDVASNTPLFVEVARGGQQFVTDKYIMTADYRPAALNFATVDAGTLTPANTTIYRTLQVNRVQVLALNMDAQNPTGTGASVVWYQLYKAGSKSAYTTWLAVPGVPTIDNVLVEPGEYVVRISASFLSSSAGGTTYDLRLLSLTDPIGLDPINPAGTGTVAPPPADWTFAANPYAYYSWLTN